MILFLMTYVSIIPARLSAGFFCLIKSRGINNMIATQKVDSDFLGGNHITKNQK